MVSALKEKHGDGLHILVAKRNAGPFTYDGIELGGERLAHEVEETLGTLTDEGYCIRKLSIVGYSLGGLVARYAIGLLDARGWFETLEPVNFATFATPHVGVRSTMSGIKGRIWNALAPRTLSASGRQLFLIDSFRGTGKPLLSVLADPGSIFVQALSRFKHRCAYANIVNDRSAVFYTTFISAADPFRKLDDIIPNYVEGYDPVVLDPDVHIHPSEQKQSEPPLPLGPRVWKQITVISGKLPLWLLVLFVLPIFVVVYLGNSVVQTFRSRQRIRLHEGENSALFKNYRVPLMIQDMRRAMQAALEDVNKQDQSIPPVTRHRAASLGQEPESPGTSTLPLTPAQLAIIDTLNNTVGFRKYPVYIHNNRHSHAAIIVRVRKDGFGEGKVVIRHWLDWGFVV